jgi:DNA-directed RNA polymerase specialized sigma24 family protein
MGVIEMMTRFGISRATAFRAKKRGWLTVGYHQRTVNMADRLDLLPVDDLYREAEIGAVKAANRLGMQITGRDKADCVQEAITRLLELSGDENFSSPRWRTGVAVNAATDLLRKIRPLRHISLEEMFQGLESEEE